jgi:hypothetical protein
LTGVVFKEHGFIVEESAGIGGRFFTKTFDRSSRIDRLGGIDTDQSNSLFTSIDTDNNGIAVNNPHNSSAGEVVGQRWIVEKGCF